MGFGNTIKPRGLEPFQFPTKIGTLSIAALFPHLGQLPAFGMVSMPLV